MTHWIDDNGTRHWLDEDGREHVNLDATQALKLTLDLTEEN